MSDNTTRRLAAILFADIVGFTSMMQEDEDKTLVRLSRYKTVLGEKVSKFNGQIFQTYGDGSLCMFPSAILAVQCAKEVQLELKQGMVVPVRIGIHQGDIVEKDKTIYGDAVNLASRVESLGVSHSVLFTESVANNLKSHPSLISKNLGFFHFKNVAEPMKVYALANEGFPVPRRAEMKGKLADKKTSSVSRRTILIGAILIFAAIFLGNRLSLITNKTSSTSGQKSIALIPFTNLNVDKAEGDFFSDGIMEEILLRLQKLSNLRTISRTSVMQYKINPKPILDIAKELAVGYVVEGTVRQLTNSVIINVSLIEAQEEEHILWAEEFTSELSVEDIFNTQSQIAVKIVNSLQATMSPYLSEGTLEAPTKIREAYNYYLKGNHYYHLQGFSSDVNSRLALENYQKAVELDPNFTLAHVKIAACNRLLYWYQFDRTELRAQLARASLNQAILIDPDLPEVRIEQAWQYYHFDTDYDRSIAILKKLKTEYPNYEDVYWVLANTLKRKGDFKEALVNAEQLLEINPRSPFTVLDAGQIGEFANAFERVEEVYAQSLEFTPDNSLLTTLMARLMMTWKWDLSKGLSILESSSAERTSYFNYMSYLLHLKSRNFEKAMTYVKNQESDFIYVDRHQYIPTELAKAQIYYYSSDDSRQKEAALKAISLLQNKIIEDNNDVRLYGELALSYAFAGEPELAIANAEKCIEIKPFQQDALTGYLWHVRLLQVLVINRNIDRAMEQLRFIMSKEGTLTDAILQNDPLYEPLRNDRRFKRIIADRKNH